MEKVIMKADVFNLQGEKSSTVELPDEIFAAKVNVDLMNQAYLRQMANARLGTHSTKRRGEVRGGGAKKEPAAPVKAARFPPNGLAAAASIPRNRAITASSCPRKCAAPRCALR
jgi:hypothetical protein